MAALWLLSSEKNDDESIESIESPRSFAQARKDSQVVLQKVIFEC